MKLLLLALVSFFLFENAEAHRVHARGRSCQKNFHFKPKDCRLTFIARNANDLTQYDQQRLMTGVDKHLVVMGNISAENIRIETQCEVKIMPLSKLQAQSELVIFAKDFDLGAKGLLKGQDVYIKTEKKLEVTATADVEAQRLLLETKDDIKLQALSEVKSPLVIFNADDCEIHRTAKLQATQKLGSCFNAPKALVKLKANPTSGNAPLPVAFDATESFGLIDELVFNFGNNETFSTALTEVVYNYEIHGAYQATVTAKGSFGSIASAPIAITVNKPPFDDFAISYGITRVNPPQVLVSVESIPDFEGGIKEYLWNFGDQFSVNIPFAMDPYGGLYHDYAQDGVYTVSLRLKGQNDLVTAPVEQVIDTRNSALPSPRYRISSFKGEAPFTVEVEALETTDPDGDNLRYFWRFTDTGETIPLGSQRVVQHTFNQAGIFRVQLYTVDSKEAQTAVSIPIYVGQQNSIPSLPPYAIMDTTNRFGLAPHTVEFSAARSFDPDGPTGQPVSYQWSFYDSGINQQVTRFGTNLSYTFTKPGTYFPVLTVTDVTGQQATYRMPIFVDGNQNPAPSFTITAQAQARTYRFEVPAHINGNDYSADSIQWHYGDGTYAYGPNSLKTYATAGNYQVKLVARKLDGPYEEFVRSLVVTDTPVSESATILANPTRFNINEPVQLSAQLSANSNPATTTYTWNFGNGVVLKGTGTQYQSVSQVYAVAGPYDVTLFAEFESGLSSYAQFRLENNQAPVMGEIKVYGLPATAPARLGFAPYETTTDADGYIAQYVYEWGDGSQPLISSNGYEEHEYAQAGNYQVKITAIDNFGGRTSNTTSVSITANQKPIAGLTIYTMDQFAPDASFGLEAWQLSNDSDGWIVQYEFDLGNGEKVYDSDGYVNYLYQAPGTYTVSLRVQDNKGLWSDIITQQLEVKANQNPIAGLQFTHLDRIAPGQAGIEIYSLSSDPEGQLRGFEINFGDGTSRAEDFNATNGFMTHDYPLAGSYNVSLRVRDHKGSWSEWVSQEIVITNNQPPIAQIEVYLQDDVAPGKVGVAAWSTSSDSDGFITSFEYNFGDGTTITSQNGYEEHAYAQAGEYTIVVRVQDNEGAWSGPTSNTVTIKPNQLPVAQLNLSREGMEVPISVTANAQGSYDPDGQIQKYIFDINGQVIESAQNVYTHVFNTYGTFEIGLVVEDENGGRSARVSQQVQLIENLKPIPQLSIYPASPYFAYQKINFSAFGSVDPDGAIVDYQWDFGNGETAAGITEEYAYPEEGNYTVTLSLRDDFGHTVTSTQIIYVGANVKPTVAMTFSPDPIQQYKIITFDASTSSDPDGEIAVYHWEFDDGESVYGRRVAKYFSDYGTQNVRLTVLDNRGGQNEEVFAIDIEQNDEFLPEPVISMSDVEGIIRQTVWASGAASSSPIGDIVSYSWDWGDGSQVATGEEVTHQYAEAGEYTIHLTVTDSNGRSNTTFKTIQYLDAPYSYEELSEYQIRLSGASETRFNPLTTTIEVGFEGILLGTEVPTLILNGVELIARTKNEVSAFYDVSFLNGKNVLEAKLVDANGGVSEKSFVFYAGSRQIEVSLSGMTSDSRIRMFLGENQEVFEDFVTSSPVATINNVPNLETVFIAKNNSAQLGYEFVSATNNSVQVTMEGLGAPSVEDFELTQGVGAWQSTAGGLQVVQDQVRKVIRSAVPPSGKLVITNTTTASAIKPYVTSNLFVQATSAETKVLSFIRNQRGELAWQYRRGASIEPVEGVRRIGTNELFLEVQSGDIVENRIIIDEPVQAVVKNSLMKGLYAIAQTTPTLVDTYTGSSAYVIDSFSMYGVGVKSSTANNVTTVRYQNRDICAFGLDNREIVVGLSNNLAVNTKTQVRLKAKLADAKKFGSDVALIGLVAMDAWNPGYKLASFVPNSPDSAVNEVGASYNKNWSETISPTNFSIHQLYDGSIRQRYTDLMLVTMEKEEFENTGLTREFLLDEVPLRAGIKLSPLTRNCEITEVGDGSSFPVLFPAYEYFTHYGKSPDIETIALGGDFWAQGHVIDQVKNMKELRFNDFSLQHGIKFEPHDSHYNGLATDFIPKNYSDAAQTFFYQKNNSVRTDRFSKVELENITELKIAMIDKSEYVERMFISFYTTKGSLQDFIPGGQDRFLSFSSNQIIRSESTAKDDLNYFLKKTCADERTLSKIVSTTEGVKAGHHDHWHMKFARASIANTNPLKNKEEIEDYYFDYGEETVKVGFRLPQTEDNTYFVDVYFNEEIGGETKERRILQAGGGQVWRTCFDSNAKENESYVADLSWCSDWEKIEPSFTNGKFEVSLTKDEYKEQSSRIAKLKVRLTTVRSGSIGFCREDIVPLIEADDCIDQSGEKVGGRIHSKGGGVVADGASVDEEVFVGPGAVVCPGVKITGEEVSIDGKVKISGDTTISGLVSIVNNRAELPTLIDALDGKIVLEGPQNGDLNRRIELLGHAQRIQGNVVIKSFVSMTGGLDIRGYNTETGDADPGYEIAIEGSCDSVSKLTGKLDYIGGMDDLVRKIDGPLRLINCFEVWESSVKNSVLTGMSNFQNGRLFVRSSTISDSTVSGNADITSSQILEDSTIELPSVNTYGLSRISISVIRSSRVKISKYLNMGIGEVVNSDLVGSYGQITVGVTIGPGASFSGSFGITWDRFERYNGWPIDNNSYEMPLTITGSLNNQLIILANYPGGSYSFSYPYNEGVYDSSVYPSAFPLQ